MSPTVASDPTRSKHRTRPKHKKRGSHPPMTLAMDGVHNAVRRVVDGLPRGSLLDVGAGYGGFSEWACDKGFEVTAMDVNPDAFQNEQIRCHAADLNGRWPVEDASYDVVVSIEVMEHLENHNSFLRECCRVCKP
ncbi:MAG: class I SAM-dependent methyltransferase, partial [Planctomycetales bacterium]